MTEQQEHELLRLASSVELHLRFLIRFLISVGWIVFVSIAARSFDEGTYGVFVPVIAIVVTTLVFAAWTRAIFKSLQSGGKWWS